MLTGFLVGIGTYQAIINIAQLKIVTKIDYDKINPTVNDIPITQKDSKESLNKSLNIEEWLKNEHK